MRWWENDSESIYLFKIFGFAPSVGAHLKDSGFALGPPAEKSKIRP
jgi:hypothetical protein